MTPTRPAWLLIDEIDKADIEFPNDLLRELDRMGSLYETRETDGEGQAPPHRLHHLNNEKGCPTPSCAGASSTTSSSPTGTPCSKIVDVHFPGIKQSLLKEALEVFFGLRACLGLKKKPSTSGAYRLAQAAGAGTSRPKRCARRTRRRSSRRHGALLKNEQDMHLFERLVFMAQRNR